METIEDLVCRLAIKLRPSLSEHLTHLKNDDYHFGLVAEIVELAIAEEREACIEVAEEWSNWVDVDHAPMTLAKYIKRERASPKDEVSP